MALWSQHWKSTITLHFWGILPTLSGRTGNRSGGYHYITFLGHPSDKALSCFESGGLCTITLHFWGILPTAKKLELRKLCKYHYITFLGHPSDCRRISGHRRRWSTITLHFWGILPTVRDANKNSRLKYHYITFLGHPSDNFRKRKRDSIKVPLHYISGASFRPSLKRFLWK